MFQLLGCTATVFSTSIEIIHCSKRDKLRHRSAHRGLPAEGGGAGGGGQSKMRMPDISSPAQQHAQADVA